MTKFTQLVAVELDMVVGNWAMASRFIYKPWENKGKYQNIANIRAEVYLIPFDAF